jgi:predicted metalloprotease
MRLRGVKGSRNVEDRRGQRMVRGGRAGGLGILGLLLVLGVGYFTGIDISPLVSGGGQPQTQTVSRELSSSEEQAGEFASRVLATTETVWTGVFEQQLGTRYDPPVMVLFSQVTPSPCGDASGATGPFYCPLDKKAYLDTAFFATMAQQMGAGGDFAAAYVIAHEVGHAVQDQLGILDQSQKLQAQSSRAQANEISVRTELQADCLAGVWAAQVSDLLEPGDVDEALNAAVRIGDDYLQRQAGQVPRPHTFTHGTSEQRQRWFATGYQNGQIADCDTFSVRDL